MKNNKNKLVIKNKNSRLGLSSKLIMISAITVLLTACGGGGGGGGSSSSNGSSNTKPVKLESEKNIPKEVAREYVPLMQYQDKRDVQKEENTKNLKLAENEKIVVAKDNSIGLQGINKELNINGNEVVNSGEIELSGKNTTGIKVANGYKGINKNIIKSSSIDSVGMEAINSDIENQGTIEMVGKIENAIGMLSSIDDTQKEFKTINSKDAKIKIEVKDRENKEEITAHATGMLMRNYRKDKIRGELLNKGTIEITGDKNTLGRGMVGEFTNIENSGKINISSGRSIGVEAINSKAVNTEAGEIKVSVNGIGMQASYNNSKAINKGRIIVNETNVIQERGESIGILGQNVVENSNMIIKNDKSGKIYVDGEWIFGMKGILGSNEEDNVNQNGNIEMLNKGEIEISGVAGSGMYGEIAEYRTNSGNEHIDIINEGSIKVMGRQVTGMQGAISNMTEKPLTVGKRSVKLINIGTVNVNGEFSSGMEANGNGVTAVNKGTINVIGEFSSGMKADGKGAVARNEGTINVGEHAYGMVAFDGGKIINSKGANIVIESSVDLSKEQQMEIAMNNLERGSVSEKSAKGIVENHGNIRVDKNMKVDNYIMGVHENGNHGMLFAKNVIVEDDANVAVKIDPKSMFDSKDKEVVMAEGEKVDLSKNVKAKTNSIIHRVELKKETTPTNEELRARIIQEAKLADYTDEQIKEIAKVFDGYIDNQESYEAVVLANSSNEIVENNDPLSEIAKRLDTKEHLNALLDRFAGVEYLNIPRQMLNINESFRKYDSSVISTLGDHNYNFEFIGEHSKNESSAGINGYKSQMTGFNGAVKLGKDMYGVAGYGYSDIDYKTSSSSEKIRTIHTGLYKDMKINEYNLRVGALGEYNFHEMDRESVNKTANSKFNSYVIGGQIEANRRFGNETYVEPMIGLNVSYGNREEFKETKAESYSLKVKEEKYTSIKPEIGMKVGKKFKSVEVFGKAKYSYELGDIDKDMNIELLNKKANIKNNKMEEGSFDISAGMMAGFNNFNFNLEVGKEFRNVDNTYVKAGISYTL